MRLGSLLLLALPLSLAACGGAPPAGKGASTAADEATPAAPEKVGDATLEVISTGEAPRRALRYSFTAGRRESMTIDMKMSMEITIADRRAPAVDLPVMRMKIAIDPKQVLSNGDLVYVYEIASADLVPDAKAKAAPELEEKLGPELKKLVGMHGEAEVTPRGVATRATMEAPPGVSDEVRSMVEQTGTVLKDLGVPMPSQPVGRGARWKTTAPVRLNGVAMTRAVELTVDAVDGDRVTIHQDIAVSAKPQVIENKRLPAGTELHLETMRGKGQGKVDLDLAKLVPTSDGASESVADMTIKAGAEQQAMSVATRIATRIAPTAK